MYGTLVATCTFQVRGGEARLIFRAPTLPLFLIDEFSVLKIDCRHTYSSGCVLGGTRIRIDPQSILRGGIC